MQTTVPKASNSLIMTSEGFMRHRSGIECHPMSTKSRLVGNICFVISGVTCRGAELGCSRGVPVTSTRMEPNTTPSSVTPGTVDPPCHNDPPVEKRRLQHFVGSTVNSTNRCPDFTLEQKQTCCWML